MTEQRNAISSLTVKRKKAQGSKLLRAHRSGSKKYSRVPQIITCNRKVLDKEIQQGGKVLHF